MNQFERSVLKGVGAFVVYFLALIGAGEIARVFYNWNSEMSGLFMLLTFVNPMTLIAIGVIWYLSLRKGWLLLTMVAAWMGGLQVAIDLWIFRLARTS